MPDFVYLAHFGIPLGYETGAYTYHNESTSFTAVEVAHGWQLRMSVKDGPAIALVVEGSTLSDAESRLVDGLNRSGEILSAALMAASAEARHAA